MGAVVSRCFSFKGMLTLRGPMEHDVPRRQNVQLCGNSGEALHIMPVVTSQTQEGPHFPDILGCLPLMVWGRGVYRPVSFSAP